MLTNTKKIFVFDATATSTLPKARWEQSLHLTLNLKTQNYQRKSFTSITTATSAKTFTWPTSAPHFNNSARGKTQAAMWWTQVCPCPPTLPLYYQRSIGAAHFLPGQEVGRRAARAQWWCHSRKWMTGLLQKTERRGPGGGEAGRRWVKLN